MKFKLSLKSKTSEVSETPKNHGARNLIILGAASIFIAIIASAASLHIYHKSGDIYLDCSLPEADCPSARANSKENNREESFIFSESGEVTKKVLDEYLKELEKPLVRAKDTAESFRSEALSNESLGI
jgi:hypothetical protein